MTTTKYITNDDQYLAQHNYFLKESLTHQEVASNLECLVNLPCDSKGIFVSFYELYGLMKRCSAERTDERFREAAYKRVIQMFSQDPADEFIMHKLLDYGTALLSHYMIPPVPKVYAKKIDNTIKTFVLKNGISDGWKKNLQILMQEVKEGKPFSFFQE